MVTEIEGVVPVCSLSRRGGKTFWMTGVVTQWTRCILFWCTHDTVRAFNRTCNVLLYTVSCHKNRSKTAKIKHYFTVVHKYDMDVVFSHDIVFNIALCLQLIIEAWFVLEQLQGIAYLQTIIRSFSLQLVRIPFALVRPLLTRILRSANGMYSRYLIIYQTLPFINFSRELSYKLHVIW